VAEDIVERTDPFTIILETDVPDAIPAVEDALRRAGIPFRIALQAEPSPRGVISVLASRRSEALALVQQCFGEGPLASEEPVESEPVEPEAKPAFPSSAAWAAGALTMLQLAVLVLLVGRHPDRPALVDAGALVSGLRWKEPWRLITYIFVHANFQHLVSNAVPLLVFTVALAGLASAKRIAFSYAAAGVAGGLTVLMTTSPGTLTVGSSGAVAGLAGLWLALSLRRARRKPLARRELVRAIGIGLLILPTLVTPETSSGERISVAAHLGGLLTGFVLGAAARPRDSVERPP
jgi:membrane associated rhomboid family serine protease